MTLGDPFPAMPRGPGVERLRAVLADARARGASDVHVVSQRPLLVRIATHLYPLGNEIDDATAQAMLMPLLDERAAQQLALYGYADFALDIPSAGRLRANVSRHRMGLKGSFRLIRETPPSLADLGLPKDIAKVTNYHQGLAVISGPNGHGKTTTMAAIVSIINQTKPAHIITVEDPVEIIHPIGRAVISQREVGRHTESFYAALKGALREDPDVICIGELRDRETVEMALSAAETGHLVIATMSTPSGAKTIDRLIDMFPPDDQAQVRATLAGALKIVVSQRLLPTADNTEMVAAAEVITGGVPLWSLIRDNKLFQLPSLLQRGKSFGMLRLEDSLRELLNAGRITEEVAMRYADDPRMLKATAGPEEGAAAGAGPGAAGAPAAAGPARPGIGGFFGRKS